MKYFTREELSCKCGCGLNVQDKTAQFADQVREQWTHYLVGLGYESKAGALLCLSGARCKTHNETVSGAPHSAHVEGLALDLAPRNLTLMSEFHKWCALKRAEWKVGMENPKFTTTWCHLQLREPFKIFDP